MKENERMKKERKDVHDMPDREGEGKDSYGRVAWSMSRSCTGYRKVTRGTERRRRKKKDGKRANKKDKEGKRKDGYLTWSVSGMGRENGERKNTKTKKGGRDDTGKE